MPLFLLLLALFLMPTALTPAERRLRASAAAHTSWARTENRSQRTATARKGLYDRFLREAGGDPVRAQNLMSAHMKLLALKSSVSRRKAREAAADAETAEQELAALGSVAEDGAA